MSWSINCANCGAPGSAADRFCASCGAPRPETAPPVVAPPDPPAVIARPRPQPPQRQAPSPPPAAPRPESDYAAVALAPSAVGIGAGPSASLDARGLIRSLYDFGFTSLISLKVIKFVYALLVIVNSIIAAISLISCFASRSGPLIVIGLIFIPLGYLIYLILLRILMELIVVFFKMGEDVQTIRDGAGTAAPFTGGRD